MPGVCEVIRVGDNAVKLKTQRGGTLQTLSNGDGLMSPSVAVNYMK
jgi:hypothetical protein